VYITLIELVAPLLLFSAKESCVLCHAAALISFIRLSIFCSVIPELFLATLGIINYLGAVKVKSLE